MRFLSINTSSNLCSVSFFDNSIVNSIEEMDVKDHSKYIAINTKKLIKNNSHLIDFIAVSIGPGSYAGLKVGLSFAKGLSLALNKPIVPIDNFTCMNMNIRDKNEYYICIYSHRKYVYSQLYKKSINHGKPNCTNIEHLKKIKIYGYGLDKIDNVNYQEIIPNSRIIGEFALKNYKKFIEHDINKVTPIYLDV